MEGNIAGVRPGITLYNEYYHQDLGADRYEYYAARKPRNEIYLYNKIDEKTGCGTAYSFTATDCCSKAMVEDEESGTCSSFYL